MKIKITYQSQFLAATCGVFAGIGMIATTWPDASAILKEHTSIRLFIFGCVLLFLAISQLTRGIELYREAKGNKDK